MKVLVHSEAAASATWVRDVSGFTLPPSCWMRMLWYFDGGKAAIAREGVFQRQRPIGLPGLRQE